MAAFPVLVVVATYGAVGPGPALAGLLALVALLPVLAPWRLRLSPAAQLLFSVALAAIGVAVITTAFVPPEPVHLGTLRLGWSAAAFALLLVCVGRLFVARPAGGDAATLAVAVFALAACGGTVSGAIFPTAVATFLVSAVAVRRLADPGRAPWAAFGWRWALGVVAAVALALASVAAAIVVLPYGHSWIVRQIMQSASARAGFSTQLSLGGLRGLLLSDEVVLRVRGRHADYLRGVVFTRYQGGRWNAGPDTSLRAVETVRSLPMDGSATQIELVEEAPERYFAPLDAAAVAVPTGLAAVDRMGVLAPVAAEPTERFWFRRGSRRAYPVAGPEADDLDVPATIVTELRPLAEQWTADASDSETRLRALEQRLQTDFRYSLDFERSPRRDPVVDFLRGNRTGHCEYFASAMALLSRSLGIPARVVGGYRVVERNQLGGHFVVRQRHAHTWVEAWVPDEGWRRYDPTPAAELAQAMPRTTPWASAVIDLLGAWWAEMLWWLDQRTPLEIVSALLALIALAVLVRWLRAWRERRAAGAGVAVEPPLPCFEQLSAALARAGIRRQAHEPVEQLARRVRDSALPGELGRQAASLLGRYAALRYGGIGDPARLDADVSSLVERLARQTASRAAR